MFIQIQKNRLLRAFISLLIWIIGIIIALSINCNTNTTNLNANKLEFPSLVTIKSDLIFVNIFVNNILIGIISSILGFLTGGIITIIVFLWNGLLLGLILKALIIETAPMYLILSHGIFEIWAFCLFGATGLKGFFFYKKLLIQNVFSNNLFPKFNEFIFFFILLTIAAFIESVIIV